MLNHYLANVRFMDKCVESSLRLQCLDENSSSYGTFWDVARGYNEPCTGISLTKQFVEAYYTPDSRYYHDDALLRRALLSMRWTNARQHEDGSLDLLETNFHDSAETGFTVHES